MGKVLFSQVSTCPQGRYPSLRFIPRSLVQCPFQGVPQSQVLSLVSGPRYFPEGGWLPPRQGGTPKRKGDCESPQRQNSRADTCYVAGRYASYGQLFLLLNSFEKLLMSTNNVCLMLVFSSKACLFFHDTHLPDLCRYIITWYVSKTITITSHSWYIFERVNSKIQVTT